jgi:hypothetical protein
MVDDVEAIGRVVERHIGVGTKSEHDAVVFVTDSGEYKLRRRGGNPFVDSEITKLVGKRIPVAGVIDSGHLIMSDWTVLD